MSGCWHDERIQINRTWLTSVRTSIGVDGLPRVGALGA
jgi:hypothetical protein